MRKLGSKYKRVPSEQSLRNQIAVLENKAQQMNPNESYWKIRGKINQLNKRLEKVVTFKWLSR